MTLTLVCMNRPNKLMQHLKEREKTITRYHHGIYYVIGMDFPVQFIIQSQLSRRENRLLHLLSDRLTDKQALQEALIHYLRDNKNE